MNDHSASFGSLVRSFTQNYRLIASMTRREISARYRGSLFGLAWSFLNPVLLLLVYTFVFSVVFNARWGGSRFGEDQIVSAAIMIFTGMVVHGFFSDCFVRSPLLVTSHANFVKRVVFPLEVLPWVALGAAAFHTIVSLFVLFAGQLIITGFIPLTALLIPFALLPLALLIMGCTWLFSAAGVYFRDLSQLSGFISTILLFLSPVFYPLSAIPDQYHVFFYVNPLTHIIEVCRGLLIYSEVPSASGMLLYCAVSVLVAYLGFAWFQKTRRGFADVL
ncbi:MAG: ABC transporter permease [Halioglobus sp.]